MTNLTKIVREEIDECLKVRGDLDKRKARQTYYNSYNSLVIFPGEDCDSVRKQREDFAMRKLRDYLYFND